MRSLHETTCREHKLARLLTDLRRAHTRTDMGGLQAYTLTQLQPLWAPWGVPHVPRMRTPDVYPRCVTSCPAEPHYIRPGASPFPLEPHFHKLSVWGT